jgi:hypothetical protein
VEIELECVCVCVGAHVCLLTVPVTGLMGVILTVLLHIHWKTMLFTWLFLYSVHSNVKINVF